MATEKKNEAEMSAMLEELKTLKAEIAAEREALKAEREAVESARPAAEPETETAKYIKTCNERAQEKVTYSIPRNTDLRKAVFAAVNGERIMAVRGRTVEIKRKFAEVLQQSDAQDMATEELQDDLVNRFVAAGEATDKL